MSAAVERVLAAYRARDIEPTRSGDGWSAPCVGHDDRKPSLSIGTGSDGRVLLHCQAGCPVERVVAALDLTMADLMSPSATSPREVEAYDYTDEVGKLLFQVVRFEPKDFRQRQPDGHGGWNWNTKGTPRVLYRLPAVLAAAKAGQTVLVLEGEKDVHAAERTGAVATTNPGGAGKWRAEYSECLRGAHVVVIADRDKPGLQHAHAVADALKGIAASVRIVEAAFGKDLHDHLGAGRTLDELVPVPPVSATPIPARWRRFPTWVLPSPLREFVEQGAASLGCDESLIAVPLLVAVAACIGNRAVLHLKANWCVPAVLWGAIVTESGQLKSPALDLVLRPLREREMSNIRNHHLLVEQHELTLDAWKATPVKERGDQPKKPCAPERLVISDVTTEAVAERLAHSPLGLLVWCDELAAWFKGFDAYHQGGRGPDVQRWLSAYDAREWIVDRKTDDAPIAIPRAAVSVVGGIQPGILKRVLGAEHFENGLAARLLLVMPPRVPKVWREAELDPAVQRDCYGVLGKLLDLRPAQELQDGALRPRAMELEPAAKAGFVAWYNRHAQRQNEADGRDAALLSKLEGTGARLALILHLARVAAGDATAATDVVDAHSVNAGTQLADWFADEGLRVYATLGESPEASERHLLIDMIRVRFGGRVTPRQLRDASRRYREHGAAEAALEKMVAAGIGHWEPAPSGAAGGRPTQVFVLDDPADDPDGSTPRSGNLVAPEENEGYRTGPAGPGEGPPSGGEVGAAATAPSSSPLSSAAAEPVRSGNLVDAKGNGGLRTGAGCPAAAPALIGSAAPVCAAPPARPPGPETSGPDLDVVTRAEEAVRRALSAGDEAATWLVVCELARLIGAERADAIEDELRAELRPTAHAG